MALKGAKWARHGRSALAAFGRVQDREERRSDGFHVGFRKAWMNGQTDNACEGVERSRTKSTTARIMRFGAQGVRANRRLDFARAKSMDYAITIDSLGQSNGIRLKHVPLACR